MNSNFWLLGIHRKLIATGTDTDGAYDFIAGHVPPGIKTPPHIHHQYAETEFVVEGELSIVTEQGTIHLKAGEGYTIPKGMPHALLALGDKPAKIITIFAPAGFAEVVKAVGIPGMVEEGTPAATTDMALFNTLSSAIGDETIKRPGAAFTLA